MAPTTAKTSSPTLKLKSFAPHLLLLIVVLATFYGSCYGSPNRIRAGKNNQIPNCCDMSSESQCLQNPKCRWCRSDALDDMCFSRSEALRLPPQVFTCKLIRFNQRFWATVSRFVSLFSDLLFKYVRMALLGIEELLLFVHWVLYTSCWSVNDVLWIQLMIGG